MCFLLGIHCHFLVKPFTIRIHKGMTLIFKYSGLSVGT
jgi:hypothetical protein